MLQGLFNAIGQSFTLPSSTFSCTLRQILRVVVVFVVLSEGINSGLICAHITILNLRSSIFSDFFEVLGISSDLIIRVFIAIYPSGLNQ